MTELLDYLTRATLHHASDLFIVAGSPVSEKLDKRVCPMNDKRVLPRDAERLIAEIYRRADRPIEQFMAYGDDDFSFSVPELARFRVSAYRQRGSMAAVVRIVAFGIPDWQEKNIPEQVMALADADQGMILVTGTAGSGKTTTQACLIDRINRTRERHIITMENPIEYLHRNIRSIVSQREISIDTEDYRSALNACLRQAPDVILLGEMSGYETIRTAMNAAETGRLLIATLHTRGAVNSIERIIDAFPAEQQPQARAQLGAVLQTVISQHLLPDRSGGRVPAFEILHMNDTVRRLLRNQETDLIDGVIAAGASEGMVTMDQSILALYRQGKISRGTALDHADDPAQLRHLPECV